MSRKPLNIDALIRIVILWGLAVVFAFILFSGRARLLVHPRIDKYMAFAGVFLLVMSLYCFEDIRKRRPMRVSPFRYTPFVAALILALTVQIIPMDASSAVSERWALGGQQPAGNTTPSPSIEPRELPVFEKSAIKLDDRNFYAMSVAIYEMPDEHAETEIELIGFVVKRDDFASNEFLVGRLMMWCCVADVVMVGFMCQAEEAPLLEPQSWVRVVGTLAVGDQAGGRVPVILVQEIEPVDPPENEYLYPF